MLFFSNNLYKMQKQLSDYTYLILNTLSLIDPNVQLSLQKVINIYLKGKMQLLYEID